MKDKIAFVAIGQAGGNIGQLFEERGFSVLYLNTSEEDLLTLEDAKFKYHITGGEGCNKDRRKAKQLVIDDYDSIATEMDAKINHLRGICQRWRNRFWCWSDALRSVD